jgi:hypothetical protein
LTTDTTRGRAGRRRGALPAVALALLLAALPGCRDGGDEKADQLLDRFSSHELAQPPPGATEVGRERRPGTDNGVTYQPTALLVLFASPAPPDEQLSTYVDRYDDRYELGPSGVPEPGQGELLGRLRDPPATVQVTVTSAAPALPGGGAVAAAPVGTRSWVLVRLQDF